MKLDSFRHFFEKYSNTKYHENPSSGSRVVPRGRAGGQADRHDEENNSFSQFCKHAYNLQADQCENLTLYRGMCGKFSSN